MWKAVFLLSLALIAAGLGNICLAKGMKVVGILPDALFQPYIIVGILLELTYFLLWLLVLSMSPVSWAVPMNAIEYIIVVILAMVLLGESVSLSRWIGVSSITVGVFFMMQSWEKQDANNEHTAS